MATAPLTEPVTLDEIKQQVEVPADDATFDDLLTAYITAARAHIENRSGHILVQRALTEPRSGFGDYIETKRPLISVTTVGYTDASGAAAPMPSTDYFARPPDRIYPVTGWPPSATNAGISVTYVAGYAAGEEPPQLLQAIKMLVAHWFAQRETVAYGLIPSEVPHGVNALCDLVFPGLC